MNAPRRAAAAPHRGTRTPRDPRPRSPSPGLHRDGRRPRDPSRGGARPPPRGPRAGALTCGRSCRWPRAGDRPPGRWGRCTVPPGRCRRPPARLVAAAAEPRPPGCGTSPSRGQARAARLPLSWPGPARPARHGRYCAALTSSEGAAPSRASRPSRRRAGVIRARPRAVGTAVCDGLRRAHVSGGRGLRGAGAWGADPGAAA